MRLCNRLELSVARSELAPYKDGCGGVQAQIGRARVNCNRSFKSDIQEVCCREGDRMNVSECVGGCANLKPSKNSRPRHS